MLRVADLVAGLRIDLSGFTGGVNAALSHAEKLGKGIKSMASSVATPIAGIGAAALAAGLEFDSAFDKIRVGTGATGSALEGLQKDFKEVFRNVPSSAAEVSGAISTLSTRLGLTGEPLQVLTNKLVTLARVTDGDVNGTVRGAARLFADWGVATEDQGKLLDVLLRTTQKTGVGIGELLGTVTTSGPVLRQMGLSVEESAAFIGTLEKNAIDAGPVVMGLGRAVANLAKQGREPQEALASLIAAMSDTTKGSETARLATELFGSRVGLKLVNAVQKGAFEFKDFAKTLTTGGDTIEGLSGDVDDFSESFSVLRHRVSEALEPLGTELMTVLNDVAKELLPLVAHLADAVKWFMALPKPVIDTTIALIGVAAALTGAAGLNAALGALGLSLGVLSGPIGLAVVAALAIAAGIAFVAMRAGARDVAVEIDRLNTLNPGLGDSLKNLESQLERTFDPEKRAELEKMVAALKKMGPQDVVANVTGKVMLGQLGRDAFAAPKVEVKVPVKPFFTDAETKLIDGLKRQFEDLTNTEADKFLAGVNEQLKDQRGAVRAAGQHWANLVALHMRAQVVTDALVETLLRLEKEEGEAADVMLQVRKALLDETVALYATEEQAFEHKLKQEMLALESAAREKITDVKLLEDTISDINALEGKKREAFRRQQDAAASAAVTRAVKTSVDATQTETEKLKLEYRERFDTLDQLRANGLMEEGDFNDAVQRLGVETTEKLKGAYEKDFQNRVASLRKQTDAVEQFYADESNARLAANAADISEGQKLLQTKLGWLQTAAGAEKTNAVLHAQITAAQTQLDVDYFGFVGAQFALLAAQGPTVWESIGNAVGDFVQSGIAGMSDFLNFTSEGFLDFEKLGKSVLNSLSKAFADFVAQQALQTFLKLAGGVLSRFAEGGFVGGGGGFGSLFGGGGDPGTGGGVGSGTDIIPALLSKGEAVLSSDTVQKMLRGDFSGIADLFGGATSAALANATTNFNMAGGGAAGVEAALFGMSASDAGAAVAAAQGAEFATANLGAEGTAGLLSSGGINLASSGLAVTGSVSGLGAAAGGAALIAGYALNDSHSPAGQQANAAATFAFAAAMLGGPAGAAMGVVATALSMFGKGGVFGGRGEQWDPLEHRGIDLLGRSIAAGVTPSVSGIIAATAGTESLAAFLGMTPEALRDMVNRRGNVSDALKMATWANDGQAVLPVVDPLAALLNPTNNPQYNPLLADAGHGYTVEELLRHAALGNPLETTLPFLGLNTPSFDRGGLARVHDGEVVAPRPFATEFPALSRALESRAFSSSEFVESNTRANRRRHGGDLRIGPIQVGNVDLGTMVIKDFRKRDAAGAKFLPSSVIFERNRS